MKSVKLASLLLASGMLLGTVHTAVTPAYTAHAAEEQVSQDAQPVDLNGKVNVVLGTITGFSKKMSHTDLKKFFNGGELVIPKKIDGKTITGIGANVFNKDTLANSHPMLSNLPGIAKLTFKAPENIGSIGNNAFKGNAIQGELSLSRVSIIGDHAFNGNELTSLNLSKVGIIGENAFNGNKLTSLKLPKVVSIGKKAFMGNSLMDIALSKSPIIGRDAFANQTPTLIKDAKEQDEVSFDELLPSLKKGDKNLELTVSNVELAADQLESGNSDNIEIDKDGRTIKLKDNSKTAVVNLTVKIKKNISPRIFDFGNYSMNPMQLTITAVDAVPAPPTGGSGGGSTTPTPDTNTPDTSTPDTNTPDTDNNNEAPIVISPDPEVNRPHTVYAKRAMRLHSNVSLTNPTKSYKKQSRAKAPSFRVLGVSYDQNGKKRYKVKGGYITASTKYVADSHFRSSKVKQVRVIGNQVNSYKNAKLSKSQKVRSYKKGTKIKVKRIVKHGRTTRFQLNNGRYISGNKQLSIMDHSK